VIFAVRDFNHENAKLKKHEIIFFRVFVFRAFVVNSFFWVQSSAISMQIFRSHLKNRILVQDRGGNAFQTGGIHLYVEDLKRGTNKDIGPKDIFEMTSK
jgi:hypothetical protein